MAIWKKILKELTKSPPKNEVSFTANRESSDTPFIVPDEEFQMLLRFYKEHKDDCKYDFKKVVLSVCPDAKPNICPYCQTKFEFNASRARKCPNCGKKMVVRQGFFIREEDVERIESKTQEFYEKDGLITQMGFELESVQHEKVNKELDRYLQRLAECYVIAAQIEDKKDSRGFSYWDKAWGHFNQARLESMKNYDSDYPYTNLPEISFDMAKMLDVQYKNMPNKKNRVIHQLSLSVAESFKFENEKPYFVEDVFKIGKKIIEELGLNSSDLEAIYTKSIQDMRLNEDQTKSFTNCIRQMEDYVLFDR